MLDDQTGILRLFDDSDDQLRFFRCVIGDANDPQRVRSLRQSERAKSPVIACLVRQHVLRSG